MGSTGTAPATARLDARTLNLLAAIAAVAIARTGIDAHLTASTHGPYSTNMYTNVIHVAAFVAVVCASARVSLPVMTLIAMVAHTVLTTLIESQHVAIVAVRSAIAPAVAAILPVLSLDSIAISLAAAAATEATGLFYVPAVAVAQDMRRNPFFAMTPSLFAVTALSGPVNGAVAARVVARVAGHQHTLFAAFVRGATIGAQAYVVETYARRGQLTVAGLLTLSFIVAVTFVGSILGERALFDSKPPAERRTLECVCRVAVRGACGRALVSIVRAVLFSAPLAGALPGVCAVAAQFVVDEVSMKCVRTVRTRWAAVRDDGAKKGA